MRRNCFYPDIGKFTKFMNFKINYFSNSIAFCRDPGIIQNGWQNVSGITKPYRVGTVIQFHCKRNFKLAKNGQPKIQCMGNGKWSGKIPKCVGGLFKK